MPSHKKVNLGILAGGACVLWLAALGQFVGAEAGTTATTTTAPASQGTGSASDLRNGITRTKTPEGGELVRSDAPPRTPRNPRGQGDYAAGDWLIENLGSEPSIITPFLDKDAYGHEIQNPIIESLLTRNPETFEWEPFLAESYEIKPDNVTIRFTLRKEAKFSDGVPVTADDVVFSFKTMMDPKIDDDRYKSSGSRIESCQKIDERTVEFKFKEPYFQALETAGGVPVIPEHVYKYTSAEEYNKKTDLLVGTGPYLFDKAQWTRGQRIVLVRNPQYWATNQMPTFDKLVYLFLQNPQAAFQEFQNGNLDEFSPQADQYAKLSKDPDFTSRFQLYNFERPNSGYRYIGWNEQNPIFADKLTRQALTMLVDRKGIIDTFQYGLAKEITGPFSPLTPQCDQTIKPLPFNVRAAKKKLLEAGWVLNANGVLERAGKEFRFELTIPSDSPNYQQISETLKLQFAKAGIIMQITPYEFSVMVDRLDKRQFDAAMLGWTGGIEEDPYQIWHSDSIEKKGSNFISWSNPEADKLIVEGRREMDEAKRLAIWHKLHAIIHEEQPYTFMMIGTSRAFIQKRFQNTAPYKTGLNSGDWYVPTGAQKYH